MELRWDRLNWKEFDNLRKEGFNRVILPVGTIEAHGVIPMGTDNIIPQTIAEKIAPELKAFVAPMVSYGITRSLLKYPGSLTVSSATFTAYLTEILCSFAEAGMEKIVIINGHGGQFDELKQAVSSVYKKTDAKVALIHWWVLCQELTEKHYETQGGHAAVDETAAMIACAPETIKDDYYDQSMIYYVQPGTNVYPIPSTILVYKKDTGALDFDKQKADNYFNDVCDKIKEFLLDVFKKWDQHSF